MQKKNYIVLNISIVISCILAGIIHFVICPLYLSLDIFGLQDATFESELVIKFYLELAFYVIFGILFIAGMIGIIFINRGTYKKNLEGKSIKNKIKLLSIVFLILTIIYSVVTIIISFINESKIGVTCIVSLIPVVFYLLIGVYAIITCWLRISSSELKSIKDNTI